MVILLRWCNSLNVYQRLNLHTQMLTMVLEYLPTKLGDFWGFYVGKYSSTMVRIWDIFPQDGPPSR